MHEPSKSSVTIGKQVVSRMRRPRLVRPDLGRVAREAVEAEVSAAGPDDPEIHAAAKEAVRWVIAAAVAAGRTSPDEVRKVAVGAVAGAVRGSRSDDERWEETGRVAIAAAVEGAAEAGLGAGDLELLAVASARRAVTIAARERADLSRMASATTEAVVTSLAACGGQLVVAARGIGRELVEAIYDQASLSDVVAVVVESAFDAAIETGTDPGSLVRALAEGLLSSAYETSPRVGAGVRHGLAMGLDRPSRLLGDAYVLEIGAYADVLSSELRPGQRWGPDAWRFAALVRAFRSLVAVGGIDMAASLAYFTLFSFFPLVALAMLLFVSLVDPDPVRDAIMDVLLFYFPASGDLFETALDYLFGASTILGISSVVALVIGSRMLFSAVNRSVNRIFETPKRSFAQNLAIELLLILLLTLLFLASLALAPLVQVLATAAQELPQVGRSLSLFIVVGGQVATVLVPLLLTGAIFLIAFSVLPTKPVAWSDAAYGAFVSMIAFEISKQGFFFFGNLVSQRSIIYGPLTSVIALLSWAFVAGLIFLFGAALTKEAGILRPRAQV